jgi:hypothetical protein
MYDREEEVNVVKDVIRAVKIMQFGRYSLAGVLPQLRIHFQFHSRAMYRMHVLNDDGGMKR